MKQSYFLPLSFIGMMFFTCGFAFGLNPMLLPVLQGELHVSSFGSYWIIAVSFLPFLIWSGVVQKLIESMGYRRTMSLAFMLFALSFAIYWAAAEWVSYPLFLIASFVSGSANTCLQSAINPYVTILGPIDSAARRISIMGICNKLAWPLPGLFLVWLVGKEVETLNPSDLFTPFVVLVGICLVLSLLCRFYPLPDVVDSGSGEIAAPESLYAEGKSSIWQFPHLWLGAITLFLYVGVETVSLSTLVDYAANLGLESPDRYAWIAPIGMVIGYIWGVLCIPRFMSQATALKVCSCIAIIGAILVPILPATWSIASIALLALGCSLMWPALWPLAMADLGRFSGKGASLLTMSIAGGAVVPTIFGALNDYFRSVAIEAGETLIGCNQPSYWICLPCFLFILAYGLWGYKIRR